MYSMFNTVRNLRYMMESGLKLHSIISRDTLSNGGLIDPLEIIYRVFLEVSGHHEGSLRAVPMGSAGIAFFKMWPSPSEGLL